MSIWGAVSDEVETFASLIEAHTPLRRPAATEDLPAAVEFLQSGFAHLSKRWMLQASGQADCGTPAEAKFLLGSLNQLTSPAFLLGPLGPQQGLMWTNEAFARHLSLGVDRSVCSADVKLSEAFELDQAELEQKLGQWGSSVQPPPVTVMCALRQHGELVPGELHCTALTVHDDAGQPLQCALAEWHAYDVGSAEFTRLCGPRFTVFGQLATGELKVVSQSPAASALYKQLGASTAAEDVFVSHFESREAGEEVLAMAGNPDTAAGTLLVLRELVVDQSTLLVKVFKLRAAVAPAAVLVVVEDLSQQHELRYKLNELQVEVSHMVASSEAQNSFALRLAQEIRTPLTGITGALEYVGSLAGEGASSASELRNCIGIALQCAMELNKVCNTMTDLSQAAVSSAGDGHPSSASRVCTLGDVALLVMDVAAKTRGNRVRLAYTLEGLGALSWGGLYRCRLLYLRQVLSQLLVESAAVGEITVGLRAQPVAGGGGELELVLTLPQLGRQHAADDAMSLLSVCSRVLANVNGRVLTRGPSSPSAAAAAAAGGGPSGAATPATTPVDVVMPLERAPAATASTAALPLVVAVSGDGAALRALLTLVRQWTPNCFPVPSLELAADALAAHGSATTLVIVDESVTLIPTPESAEPAPAGEPRRALMGIAEPRSPSGDLALDLRRACTFLRSAAHASGAAPQVAVLVTPRPHQPHKVTSLVEVCDADWSLSKPVDHNMLQGLVNMERESVVPRKTAPSSLLSRRTNSQRTLSLSSLSPRTTEALARQQQQQAAAAAAAPASPLRLNVTTAAGPAGTAGATGAPAEPTTPKLAHITAPGTVSPGTMARRLQQPGSPQQGPASPGLRPRAQTDVSSLATAMPGDRTRSGRTIYSDRTRSGRHVPTLTLSSSSAATASSSSTSRPRSMSHEDTGAATISSASTASSRTTASSDDAQINVVLLCGAPEAPETLQAREVVSEVVSRLVVVSTREDAQQAVRADKCDVVLCLPTAAEALVGLWEGGTRQPVVLLLPAAPAASSDGGDGDSDSNDHDHDDQDAAGMDAVARCSPSSLRAALRRVGVLTLRPDRPVLLLVTSDLRFAGAAEPLVGGSGSPLVVVASAEAARWVLAARRVAALYVDLDCGSEEMALERVQLLHRAPPDVVRVAVSGPRTTAAAADAAAAVRDVAAKPKPASEELFAAGVAACGGSNGASSPQRLRALRTSSAASPRPLRRVLIADDVKTNLVVGRLLLERLGCDVVTATSGEQALEAFAEQGPFDVLFLDCFMPQLSGFEVAHGVRERERDDGLGARTPIVAVTADARAANVEHCRAAGMDDVLIKPISMHSISRVLEQYESAPVAAAAPVSAPAPVPVPPSDSPPVRRPMGSGRHMKPLVLDAAPSDDYNPEQNSPPVSPSAASSASGPAVLIFAVNATAASGQRGLQVLRLLAQLGCETEETDTLETALDAWRSGRFAVVLVDLVGAPEDSVMLVSQLRREEAVGSRSSTPILGVCTVARDAQDDVLKRAYAAGMTDAVGPPVSLPAFRGVFRQHVTMSSSSTTVVPMRPSSPATASGGGGRRPRVASFEVLG